MFANHVRGIVFGETPAERARSELALAREARRLLRLGTHPNVVGVAALACGGLSKGGPFLVFLDDAPNSRALSKQMQRKSEN